MKNRLFSFIHNAIVHPLMEVSDNPTMDFLHEVTARVAFENQSVSHALDAIAYRFFGYRVTTSNDKQHFAVRFWAQDDSRQNDWIRFEYGKIRGHNYGFGFGNDPDEGEYTIALYTFLGWGFVNLPSQSKRKSDYVVKLFRDGGAFQAEWFLSLKAGKRLDIFENLSKRILGDLKFRSILLSETKHTVAFPEGTYTLSVKLSDINFSRERSFFRWHPSHRSVEIEADRTIPTINSIPRDIGGLRGYTFIADTPEEAVTRFVDKVLSDRVLPNGAQWIPEVEVTEPVTVTIDLKEIDLWPTEKFDKKCHLANFAHT